MSLPIRWSAEAEDTFADIITHLELYWSEKEVRKFLRKTNDVLKQISAFPLMYKASRSRQEIRRGFLTKQCSLFYEIKEDYILLLYFWDNRRKPTSSN